ncbi:MAG: urate hydroxylase PuuD [Xanthobacteraceae bacterium]
MASVLLSLPRTIVAGVVLLVLIVLLVDASSGHWVNFSAAWWSFFMRWLHVLSGVMWVGLLYYLNFVQIPTVPKIEPAEHRAAISKYIAPNVLFWFRYGALSTVVTGLILGHMMGYFPNALIFKSDYAIGIGMWLALIMAFNVWFIIWPNQKKALGLVECPADQKPKAARIATLTSRFNTLLSVPMLYCMVAQQNGGL